MADQEHLAILTQRGRTWDRWRKEHPDIKPDLSDADLSKANLNGANLIHASLVCANLSDAKLSRAILFGAFLRGANLSGADLHGATLIRAKLELANLRGADLREADLSKAVVGGTIFSNLDLSTTKGLHDIKHEGPSEISNSTFYLSRGNIPEVFLRGAGVPDSLIAYMPSRGNQPIGYYGCFISYSSQDQEFAERLHNDLQGKGVRCWFAPHDMKIGDEIRTRIDETIRIHDKLLLVLSEHSLASNWVKKEVETAFEKEDQQKKLMLFPIRLDDAVMHTSQAWAADIRRMRHIGDFSSWKNHDDYQRAFDRLLRDLNKVEA